MEAGSKIIARKGHFLLKGKGRYSLSLSAHIPRLLLNFLKAFTTTSLSETTGIARTAGLLLLFLFVSITVFSQTQTFPGNGTFTVPAGVTSITVECWGGGGAGGGNTTNSSRGGGGGAGGAYARRTITVIPGTDYTVNVAASTSGTQGTGAVGNPSWFSTTGTVYAQGGAGGAAPNGGTANGGIGSSASSIGDIAYAGGNGANGTTLLGGAGGGGAGSTGVGGNAAGINAGTGAANGGGNGGAGRNNEGDGNDGYTMGGGGGGAYIPDNTNHNGGTGAAGQVLVTWTCPTYSLTSTSPTSVCSGNSSVVTLTSTATGLPVGSYTVTYNLTGTNTAIGSTAVFTVTTAGSAIFNTSILANGGATTITITNLASAGCTNAITANNTGTITVGSIPSQPSTITGNTTPCAGTLQIYSVTNIAGTTYTWAFPVGWTQTGGGTTNSVTVTVGATAGNITVTPSNTCGTGTARLLAVTPIMTPVQPSVIAGSSTPCVGTSQVYSVTNVAGTTYTWIFPAGWTQTAGGTTNSVTVTVGATTGSITVTPSNTCGAGTARLLTVSPITIPAQPSAIEGSTTPCLGTSQAYSVTNVTGTSYTWTFPSGWIQTAGGTTNSVTVTVGATPGNITVSPSNTCGNGLAQSLAIIPMSVPAQPGAISGTVDQCRPPGASSVRLSSILVRSL